MSFQWDGEVRKAVQLHLKNLKTKALNGIITAILVLQEKEPDKEESVTSESATSQGQLTEQVVLDGFLVFKDGLPVGELGEAATKGLILYTGREKTSSISVPGIDGGMVNLEIVQIKVKPKF